MTGFPPAKRTSSLLHPVRATIITPMTGKNILLKNLIMAQIYDRKTEKHIKTSEKNHKVWKLREKFVTLHSVSWLIL